MLNGRSIELVCQLDKDRFACSTVVTQNSDFDQAMGVQGRFGFFDDSWRQTISAAKVKPKVIEFCDNAKLLERFRESEILLDQVQKGLSDYLETKRSVFARFYFLSNDELLEILSETKDPLRVQPHLRKCFEGIKTVNFQPDLTITGMYSPEQEYVPFVKPVDPKNKNIEAWMVEVKDAMVGGVRDNMWHAILDYTECSRTAWMQKWAGMCVLNGSQMHWTNEMEQLFLEQGVRGPVTMLQQQVAQREREAGLAVGK